MIFPIHVCRCQLNGGSSSDCITSPENYIEEKMKYFAHFKQFFTKNIDIIHSRYECECRVLTGNFELKEPMKTCKLLYLELLCIYVICGLPTVEYQRFIENPYISKVLKYLENNPECKVFPEVIIKKNNGYISVVNLCISRLKKLFITDSD